MSSDDAIGLVLTALSAMATDIGSIKKKIHTVEADISAIRSAQKTSRTDIAALHDRCSTTCKAFLEKTTGENFDTEEVESLIDSARAALKEEGVPSSDD